MTSAGANDALADILTAHPGAYVHAVADATAVAIGDTLVATTIYSNASRRWDVVDETTATHRGYRLDRADAERLLAAVAADVLDRLAGDEPDPIELDCDGCNAPAGEECDPFCLSVVADD
jgi:hypothetical protein